VGVKLVAAAVAAAAVVTLSSTPAAVHFLRGRQLPNGGFAEAGGRAYPQLTAWVALGLKAGGAGDDPAALKYLLAHEDELTSPADIALALLAETAIGDDTHLIARVRRFARPSGAFGTTVNGTIWSVIALREAEATVPRATVRWLLRRQTRSGGWSWNIGGAADSNDTAAAVEALRSVGVRGPAIRRALRFLMRFANRDGGFALTRGRGSDTQSTAWVIQAFVAAGKAVPRGAVEYLRRRQAADGSFRYSRRYATTPVWVTAQVLPALARRPFPLR
jgi:Squalene-hopene cyclase C-terminal domain/Prenyltransferase and squalene oxidase repeat